MGQRPRPDHPGIHKAIASLDVIYPPVFDAATIKGEFADGNSFLADRSSEPLVTDYLALREILLGKTVHAAHSHSERRRVPSGHCQPVAFRAGPSVGSVGLSVRDPNCPVVQRCRPHQSRSTAASANVTITRPGDGVPSDVGNSIRRWVQVAYESSFDRDHDIATDNYPPYSWLRTTLLLREEVERLGSFGRWLESVVNAQVASLGLRQQLVLIAYRIDHGNYPESLDALAPTTSPSCRSIPIPAGSSSTNPRDCR